MGGVMRGSDVNGYEITTRLADLCNAEHAYFTAPLYASSPEDREVLLHQGVIQDILNKVRSCDAIAIAAGDLESSLLVRDALPDDITASELIAKGGVGDILGYILAADGDEIDHPINQRLIGVSLEDLARVPNVILAAGGAHKLEIIRAALARGMVNTLVTDEAMAEALVAG
jgi:DNA-binding transcriptional regulator LsrR (DeoR family)